MKQMIVCVGLFGIIYSAHADDNIATLRGEVSITDQPPAPRMEQVEDHDIKRKRNYPMQPPTIPHAIDKYYQVDLFVNKSKQKNIKNIEANKYSKLERYSLISLPSTDKGVTRQHARTQGPGHIATNVRVTPVALPGVVGGRARVAGVAPSLSEGREEAPGARQRGDSPLLAVSYYVGRTLGLGT